MEGVLEGPCEGELKDGRGWEWEAVGGGRS